MPDLTTEEARELVTDAVFGAVDRARDNTLNWWDPALDAVLNHPALEVLLADRFVRREHPDFAGDKSAIVRMLRERLEEAKNLHATMVSQASYWQERALKAEVQLNEARYHHERYVEQRYPDIHLPSTPQQTTELLEDLERRGLVDRFSYSGWRVPGMVRTEGGDDA